MNTSLHGDEGIRACVPDQTKDVPIDVQPGLRCVAPKERDQLAAPKYPSQVEPGIALQLVPSCHTIFYGFTIGALNNFQFHVGLRMVNRSLDRC